MFLPAFSLLVLRRFRPVGPVVGEEYPGLGQQHRTHSKLGFPLKPPPALVSFMMRRHNELKPRQAPRVSGGFLLQLPLKGWTRAWNDYGTGVGRLISRRIAVIQLRINVSVPGSLRTYGGEHLAHIQSTLPCSTAAYKTPVWPGLRARLACNATQGERKGGGNLVQAGQIPPPPLRLQQSHLTATNPIAVYFTFHAPDSSAAAAPPNPPFLLCVHHPMLAEQTRSCLPPHKTKARHSICFHPNPANNETTAFNFEHKRRVE